jgi:hypothetical protein
LQKGFEITHCYNQAIDGVTFFSGKASSTTSFGPNGIALIDSEVIYAFELKGETGGSHDDVSKRIPPAATNFKLIYFVVTGFSAQIFVHSPFEGEAAQFEGEIYDLLIFDRYMAFINVFTGLVANNYISSTRTWNADGVSLAPVSFGMIIMIRSYHLPSMKPELIITNVQFSWFIVGEYQCKNKVLINMQVSIEIFDRPNCIHM